MLGRRETFDQEDGSGDDLSDLLGDGAVQTGGDIAHLSTPC